jgi:hypothetical protein
MHIIASQNYRRIGQIPPQNSQKVTVEVAINYRGIPGALIIIAFLIAETSRKTILAARGACNTGSDVTIRFLDPIWYRLAAQFFGYLSPFKSYLTFFTLHAKCLLKILGK